MRRLLAILVVLLGLAPASAQQQVNLANFPSSSVVGRLGSSVSGPAQAISFATLLAQLNSVNAVISTTPPTVKNDIVTWASTAGTTVSDSGISLSGTGSIALGTSGAISITSGKTLTDTSGAGAVLLLGSTGGGFTGYAGVTCATGALTALSAAGASTCSAAKAATNSTVASPTAPNSTSAFKMQGLAGAITPAVTGNVLITISGSIITGSCAFGNGVKYQLSYGTGAAPTTNGTLAGTQVGTIQTRESPTTCTTAADDIVPFSISAVVTGLTVGTAIWIDLAAESVTSASEYGFSAVNIAANEI